MSWIGSPAALLRFKSVWGRQALNEVGHQVAIGAMFTTPKNPLFKALYEQMKKVFDGECEYKHLNEESKAKATILLGELQEA